MQTGLGNVLEKLVRKANYASNSAWKWVLGILISVGVAFLIWYNKYRTRQLARLEAKERLERERAKDMQMRAEYEENKAAAAALTGEAQQLRERAHTIDVRLIAKKKEIEAAKKSIAVIVSWKELEARAKGKINGKGSA